MKCYDSSTRYKKFGSETAWLFLSCYMNAKTFLLVSYIYLGISLEMPVF